MVVPDVSDPDLLVVPPMRSAWIPLIACIGLLTAGLVWGGTQVVNAAGGDGCEPVRDPLAITTLMSRPDPRDAGKPTARLLLPQLVGARQVEVPHAPGLTLVAGYVRGVQLPVLGPGVWEVRKSPAGQQRESQVFARNAVAHALARQITSFPPSAGGVDLIARVLGCVRVEHSEKA